MNKFIKKDLKYIWHPYTQMKECKDFPPILIEKAKGLKLYDNKGNFYYDTISSWWCNVHGHNHPQITQAIQAQADKLEHILFAGFTHQPAIELAEKLVKITPQGLNKVFFSDNGSTAIEVALKMSLQYWLNHGKKNKNKFIALDHAYHGDTIGAMSVSGIGLFNEPFKPLFFKSFRAPSPYCYRCPMKKKRKSCCLDCIKPLEKLIKVNRNEIAAIILEPLVMAAGGMIIYPKEYLEQAVMIAKRNHIHVIFDEVATGFGRTARMFAANHIDTSPDFLCLSKGITSGSLPLAATLTTDDIYDAFYADYKDKKTFYHGHTYTANPIACAAANASINIFKQEKTLSKAKKPLALFHQKLESFKNLPLVGVVRYVGVIGALDLVKNKKNKKPFAFTERIGLEIYKEGLKRNLILRPLGNVTYFFLPLCVTEKEIEYIMNNTYRIIKDLGR